MIKVDENVCIGCGACTYIDGDTFKMNEKNISEVVQQKVTDDTRQAEAGCPVGAIVIEEEASNEVVDEAA